jgi:hypothetical protein
MAGLLILGGFAFMIYWHRSLRAEVRRNNAGGGDSGGGWDFDGDGDGGGDGGGGD